METNKVKVEIFGNSYNIQGDASPEYIQKLADYVDDKMEEVSKNVSQGNLAQIAILVALNIADEYHQLKKITSGIEGVIEEKAKSLISMLDEGMIGEIIPENNSISE
ncbi:cell division protein ZapA [Spirochaetota bacterium]